jgi:hypothetical protein
MRNTHNGYQRYRNSDGSMGYRHVLQIGAANFATDYEIDAAEILELFGAQAITEADEKPMLDASTCTPIDGDVLMSFEEAIRYAPQPVM